MMSLMKRPLAVALVALWMASGQVQAQESDKRLAQVRDQARRAQQALQAAQQDQEALRRDKDGAGAERGRLQDGLAGAQRLAVQQQRRAEASLAEVRAERDQLREALAAEREARQQLAAQAQALTRDQDQLSRQLEAQRRVSASVTALLQTQHPGPGARAEASNGQLHALGSAAVQAYESRTPEAQRARDEPFFGLAKVRITNEAEALQKALDEALLRPTAPDRP